MGEPLEHLYFNWLCAQVIDARKANKAPKSERYWTLLKVLHNTEFVYVVSRDKNRADDGIELREYFLLLGEIPDDPDWRNFPGASVLEVLIGFSRRASFQTDDPPADWFWEFMRNLGLDGFNDASNVHPQDIVDILDVFIWRTYGSDGHGGLFPLENPQRDQRKVEIWYQFCDYLIDKNWSP